MYQKQYFPIDLLLFGSVCYIQVERRQQAGRRVKFFLRVLPVSPSFFNTMNISLSCGNWKQMHHPRLAKHYGVIFFLNWHFWAKNLNSFEALLLDFSVLKFLSNQRNWHTKNLSNYVKLQFWMIKFTVVQKKNNLHLAFWSEWCFG